MMFSPQNDHLHSRSIVDDGAADSGEKEPLRSESCVDSIHGGQDKEESNLDKKPKEQHDPRTTSSSESSEHIDDSDHDNSSVGDHASTSSSSSSMSSAQSSASASSTAEGINDRSSPPPARPGNTGGIAAAVGCGSASTAALHQRNKMLTTAYSAVYEPRPADILLGRGKPFQSHPGNQFMLHAVDQWRDQYLATDRKGKHNIIEHVLGLIKGRGGRFLVRIDENEENSPWMEVKRSISYRKVGHAFRSKARRAPPTTGALHLPDWLMQNESIIPRSSSTGSSSRHIANPSIRGAHEADAGRGPPKRDDDFVIDRSPFLTAAQGGDPAKIPSPLAKSRAQLKSGASTTGFAPLMRKGLVGGSKGTHTTRITAVNPLLRLPDRLPASSRPTRLVQDEDNRGPPVGDHATIWALQPQQQQQTHLMALNNKIAALEHRLAQHDAAVALRDREQQILNLLSHRPQQGASPGGGGSGRSIVLQGSSSFPLLQAGAAALRFQSRLPLPTTSAASAYTYAPTHAISTSRHFGPDVNDFLLTSTAPTPSTNQSQQRGTTLLSSSILSPLAGAFGSSGGGGIGGRGAPTSNFLLDPPRTTTSAAELLILEHKRRRELMQQDFMASQQRLWAGAGVAAAAAGLQHHHQHHQQTEAELGRALLPSLTTTSTNSDASMAGASSSIRRVNKRRDDSMENEESAATLSPSSKKRRQRTTRER